MPAIKSDNSPSTIPTRDEVIQLARDLVPALKERAQATDDLRRFAGRDGRRPAPGWYP